MGPISTRERESLGMMRGLLSRSIADVEFDWYPNSSYASVSVCLEYTINKPPFTMADAFAPFRVDVDLEAERAFDTRQIHAGAKPDPATKARAVPIYATAVRRLHKCPFTWD